MSYRLAGFVGALALLPASPPTLGAEWSARVFDSAHARQALRVAQRECRPLVMHFLADGYRGAVQARSFYGPVSPIPDEVLERVVIVLIPRSKYAGFAAEMGIHGDGGIRSISPYDLRVADDRALNTARTVQESALQWRKFCGTVGGKWT